MLLIWLFKHLSEIIRVSSGHLPKDRSAEISFFDRRCAGPGMVPGQPVAGLVQRRQHCRDLERGKISGNCDGA